MAIKLDRADLGATLERAYQLARSGSPLPKSWLAYVERIEEAPTKTFVAALGAALLAKATNDQVDSLARSRDAGPRGYSIRSVGEFMATQAEPMGFDLGVPGRWPLNNSPFYRNNSRIDRFDHIKPNSRPYYDDLVRYLRELERLSAAEALEGLAAFLSRRIAYRDAALAARRELAAATSRLADVIEISRLFVTEDPEGGRRGQSFTAAVLDCAYADVRLRSINDPNPIDVSAWMDDVLHLGVEVKQLPADEATALALARDVAAQGGGRALLVAVDPKQRLLDASRIRAECLIEHGVLTETCGSIEELVARFLLAAPGALVAATAELQERVLARLQEHGLPQETIERWAGLCESLAAES